MIAIIEAYQSGLLTWKHIKHNLIAGIVVGIVALPLAMAFAMASGVKPEQGIYTAIMASFIVGIFGGTRSQISGPTGAFVVILAAITAQHGIVGLQIATMMAGVILILLGVCKLGNVIKIIPYPVILGFTGGIGVIIFVGQWKDFFGLSVTIPIDASFYTKCHLLIEALPRFDPNTTCLSLFSLLILIISPRYIKIPSTLIAILVATLTQYYYDFANIATIGSVFGHIPQSFPAFGLPDYSQITLSDLIIPAFTIALLGAIESLLSATTADTLTGTKHHANQELKGQGYANFIAPLFGGFASTGAIARTVTNIKNGGTSPIAAVVHAIFLLLVLLLLAPYAIHIPLAVLAAILFVVAFNMSDIPEFIHTLKGAPWYDSFVLVTTFLLTIFIDLVIAVTIGVILSGLFFLMRTHQTIKINKNNFKHIKHFAVTPKIGTSLFCDGLIYTLEGPFFFGVSEQIEHALAIGHIEPKFVVFQLSHMPFIDMTGLKALSKTIRKYQNRGIKVYLCGMNKKVAQKISKIGILKILQGPSVFESLEEITKFQEKNNDALAT
ncbi:MAG: SulP family inorganic anion transporter [Candidatus Berkiella sp.]